MARQREFDEDKVLDALQDVFWEHGYDGASNGTNIHLNLAQNACFVQEFFRLCKQGSSRKEIREGISHSWKEVDGRAPQPHEV